MAEDPDVEKTLAELARQTEELLTRRLLENTVLRRRPHIRVYCILAALACVATFFVAPPGPDAPTSLAYLLVAGLVCLVLGFRAAGVSILLNGPLALWFVPLLAVGGYAAAAWPVAGDHPRAVILLGEAYVLLAFAAVAFLMGGEHSFFWLACAVAIGCGVILLNLRYPERVPDQLPPLAAATVFFIQEHFARIRLSPQGLESFEVVPFPQTTFVSWDEAADVETDLNVRTRESRHGGEGLGLGWIAVTGNGKRISINTVGFAVDADLLCRIIIRVRNL